MFNGFNVRATLPKNPDFTRYYSLGQDLFDQYRGRIAPALRNFTEKGGNLDGSAIQKDWFPEISVDIFISHSHQDTEQAITLSGWLWDNFQLRAFIDSCVWGYANDLLWQLDNQYSLISPNLFDYQKCNQSSAHVHMILTTALSMIVVV